MLLRNIYEKAVLSGANMPPVQFVTAFNLFTDYLLTRYGMKFVIKPSAVYTEAATVDDDVAVRDSFAAAYVDYIIGTAQGNEAKASDAVAKADFAFRAEWRESVKGKGIRKERWY